MSERTFRVWRLGFDNRPNFFNLYCDISNRKRLALCHSAIDLLGQAWPHLLVSEMTMSESDYKSTLHGGKDEQHF
jgi:hypothetical protein